MTGEAMSESQDHSGNLASVAILIVDKRSVHVALVGAPLWPIDLLKQLSWCCQVLWMPAEMGGPYSLLMKSQPLQQCVRSCSSRLERWCTLTRNRRPVNRDPRL